MSRPRYESEQDRQAERDVIEVVTSKLGADYRKLPITYGLDFAVHKLDRASRPWFFAEVKVRSFPMHKYQTSVVNLDKVMAAKELHDVTKLPCYLVVKWSCGRLGTIDFSALYRVGYGGRTDRGDWQDQGLVAHYDIEGFNLL